MSTDKLVRAIAQRSENRRCFDCGNLGSYSVVPSLAIFVCMDCSGRHIKCGQRAKNLSMSNFTPEEVSALDAGGNAVAASTWLAKWKPDAGGISRPVPKNLPQIDAWVQAVFLDKRYYSSAPVAPAATQRAADADQIPVRPVSEVLGGAPGAVKLTVSPTPSSPSAPLQRQGAPAATQSGNTGIRQPQGAPEKVAPLSAFAGQAAAAMATAAAFEPLGFTDNAFGAPAPTPAKATAPGVPPSYQLPAPASAPTAQNHAAPSSFDPFGSFIMAPPPGSAAVVPGQPATSAAATIQTTKPVPASGWPASPSTTWGYGDQRTPSPTSSPSPPEKQVRSPSTGGTISQGNAADACKSSGGGGGTACPLPPPPAPAQRPSHAGLPHPEAAASSTSGWTASSSAGGFHDDADWGAFAAAPPTVPAIASAPQPQSLAHTSPSSSSSSQHQPQAHQQQLQQGHAMPSSSANISQPRSCAASGGGVAVTFTQPPQQQSQRPAPPPRRTELPSDLFSEPMVQPMGVGVPVFRPMMGPQPGLLAPGQAPMVFPAQGMAGADMAPFRFPGGGLPSGMGIGSGMMAPPGMMGGFAGMGLASPPVGTFPYALQPAGMLPGVITPTSGGITGQAGLGQGPGVLSFGQMATALPKSSGSVAQQQLRETMGNPFA